MVCATRVILWLKLWRWAYVWPKFSRKLSSVHSSQQAWSGDMWLMWCSICSYHLPRTLQLMWQSPLLSLCDSPEASPGWHVGQQGSDGVFLPLSAVPSWCLIGFGGQLYQFPRSLGELIPRLFSKHRATLVGFAPSGVMSSLPSHAPSDNLPNKPLTFQSLPQSLLGETNPRHMVRKTCGHF